MGFKKKTKVDDPHGQSAIDNGREAAQIIEAIPKNERIDFDIGDIIRARPEQIPDIIKSYNEWAAQWK